MQQPENLFDARLDLVPQNPGVYLMKDAAGSVIYVGKAVNLHNRLRSYFTANPQGTPKVLAMIGRIADFETILCSNELEALVLESTLIKRHQPKYNILLRDDRDYPYIRITMNETYPRILKAFRIGSDREAGARYYGPYLGGDVYRALQALYSVFPVKTCRRQLPRDIGKERPCLNYHIGRCIGPCAGEVPAEAYRAVASSICRFLEGRYQGLIDDLRREMEVCAAEMRFEQAALVRDRIQALERLMNRQSVVSGGGEDQDVLGISQNSSEVCLQKLEFRQGRLVAAAAFFWPASEDRAPDILNAFISQHYPDAPYVPPLILVTQDWPDKVDMEKYLQSLRRGSCRLVYPRRGPASRLLEMARANAEESLRRRTLQGGGQPGLQAALEQLGGLAAEGVPPSRIEAFDISNNGSQDRVASMVVFQDGKPQRQQYRLFRLEQAESPDDYMAMREALRRRFRHLGEEDFGGRPNLVLVDGGFGHITAARQVFAEMGLDLPVAGMVKDDRHRTRGLALPEGEVVELAPGATANPAEDLDARRTERLALLRLLTAIQDEAHRFAGSYRSKLAKRRQTRFSLEGIPGIGPARRRLLLTYFQTIKGVSEASEAALQAVPGLPPATVQAVFRHFHPEEGA